MKKSRIDMKLGYYNGQEVLSVRDKQELLNVDSILNLLRNGIKTKEIEASGKVIDERSVKYNFYVYEYDEESEKRKKNIISIRVLHSDAKHFERVLNTLDDFMEMSASIKKVNRNRILAGIASALVIITAFGPTIAKGIGEKLQQDADFTRHEAPSSYSTMSDEEQKELYYQQIVERYENGDETVKEEYEKYCMEKSIMEALENTQNKVR